MEIGTIPGLAAVHPQVAEALRSQLSGLQALAGELGRARCCLPDAGGDGVWRGEAHRRYLSALEQLATLIHSASGHVDDAIRHTRLALAAVGQHGR
jgi:hypothetical protein